MIHCRISKQSDLLSKSGTEIDHENVVKRELLYIADKSLFDEGEPELITLYRYLGLKHRSLNPLREEHFDMNQDLRHLLSRAICDSCLRYFEIRDKEDADLDKTLRNDLD